MRLRRQVVCIIELKVEYCKNNHLNIKSQCFCCEYNEGKEDCSQCPLDWDVTKQCCTNNKSLYTRITNWTLTWQEQADLARQIANLPERKDEEKEDGEKKVREAIKMLRREIRECKEVMYFYANVSDSSMIRLQERKIELRQTAIEALEKQLVKKPIEIDDAYTPKIGEFRVAKCPNCRKEVSDRFDVCLECGQKLDWSEDRKVKE